MNDFDYSQQEIDHIIGTLLDEFTAKLTQIEIRELEKLRGHQVTQQQRDVIIAMYDRMAEPSY